MRSWQTPKEIRMMAALLVACVLVPSAVPAATHIVNVANFAFTPQDITVQVGDTIEWNWGTGDHTVANGTNPFEEGAGAFFNSPMDSGTPVFQWVVADTLGVLPYHCGPHWFAGMAGTITIEPGAPTAVRHDVTVRDFEFDPFTVSIASGDTVCWKWETGVHTTTSGSSSDPMHNPGALWDAIIDGGNQEFCFVFDSQGLFPYFSTPDEFQGMTGVVVVDQSTTGLPQDGEPLAPTLLAPYPNPSTKNHNMQLVLEADVPVRMDIYDLRGRKVFSQSERMMTRGTNMLRWAGETNMGHTAGPGMYLVRVQAGPQVLFTKLFRAASSHATHH